MTKSNDMCDAPIEAQIDDVIPSMMDAIKSITCPEQLQMAVRALSLAARGQLGTVSSVENWEASLVADKIKAHHLPARKPAMVTTMPSNGYDFGGPGDPMSVSPF